MALALCRRQVTAWKNGWDVVLIVLSLVATIALMTRNSESAGDVDQAEVPTSRQTRPSRFARAIDRWGYRSPGPASRPWLPHFCTQCTQCTRCTQTHRPGLRWRWVKVLDLLGESFIAAGATLKKKLRTRAARSTAFVTI